MASTTAGTHCGSSAIVAGDRRACRRQVNTCSEVSPCRRAISETTAPSVSSTIRALSSLENQPRRPVSVITSSRRGATSDLSVWSSIDTSRSLQRDPQTRLSLAAREGRIKRRLALFLSHAYRRRGDLPFLSNTDMRRLRGRGHASVASLLEQSALGPRLEPIRHRCAQEKETYGRARWGSVSSPLPATTAT